MSLGNPILCNCNMRPLQRWLFSQLRTVNEYITLSCVDYETSINRTIFNTTEAEMPCDMITLMQNSVFEVTPDAKFREVTR